VWPWSLKSCDKCISGNRRGAYTTIKLTLRNITVRGTECVHSRAIGGDAKIANCMPTSHY